ncbi:MAG: hypothetical protein NT120_02735 [Candidatus Aenigmarchaeota archaeon]|nr:hypothetical protein [Candidatus Aenigmarchaeota archaeon]
MTMLVYEDPLNKDQVIVSQIHLSTFTELFKVPFEMPSSWNTGHVYKSVSAAEFYRFLNEKKEDYRNASSDFAKAVEIIEARLPKSK